LFERVSDYEVWHAFEKRRRYTCAKATENVFKAVVAATRGGHPQCMSIIPATPYAARLRHYLGQNTE
jgi:endo-alpha-1,4-polygalactosaminidase (GH114 family)